MLKVHFVFKCIFAFKKMHLLSWDTNLGQILCLRFKLCRIEYEKKNTTKFKKAMTEFIQIKKLNFTNSKYPLQKVAVCCRKKHWRKVFFLGVTYFSCWLEIKKQSPKYEASYALTVTSVKFKLKSNISISLKLMEKYRKRYWYAYD